MQKKKIKLDMSQFDSIHMSDFQSFDYISCDSVTVAKHLCFLSKPATSPPVSSLVFRFSNQKIVKNGSAVTIGEVLSVLFNHVAGHCEIVADERADRIGSKGNRYDDVYDEIYEETWSQTLTKMVCFPASMRSHS